MTASRVCSECGESLSGRAALARTCSTPCRQKRARRLKQLAKKEPELKDTVLGISHIVRGHAPDVIDKVMHEELRPIVREALTEEVLRSVQQMLGLSPRAVELLEQDLESEDPIIRQRAYTLVTKYTIGHPALLQPKDTQQGGQMVVQFNLPRPDNPEPNVGEPPLEAEELRVCEMCHAEKQESAFAAGSARCQDCFDAWRETILREFA